jgi:hypothetical protein
VPKIVDYPRASLKNSLQLAKAVDELGGRCTAESAAESLGKKISGAFNAVIGASVKYGLISSKQGQLAVESRYRDYKLAYSDDERNRIAQQALLTIPLFQKIYDRFKDHKLPVDHFEKLLVRELEVPEELASRVSLYFIEGAKRYGLMNADNTFVKANTVNSVAAEVDNGEPDLETGITPQDQQQSKKDNVSPESPLNVPSESFSIRVQGPGLDSVIVVNEPEDLEIVNVMLKKVARKLAERAIENTQKNVPSGSNDRDELLK